MRLYRCDFHIHTVLSPCGDLDMSPSAIVKKALEMKLDAIAVTDHNTTRHCRVTAEIGEKAGLVVIPGVEVNTSEEVHCLAFFDSLEVADEFQQYLDKHLPDMKNDPDFFGYQVQVDENEHVVYEEEKLLWAGLNQSLDQVIRTVKNLNGLVCLSHVDRKKNSVFSQLGLFPAGLPTDAIEISKSAVPEEFLKQHPELEGIPYLTNSDAHFLCDIAIRFNLLRLESVNLSEIKMALLGMDGRMIGRL